MTPLVVMLLDGTLTVSGRAQMPRVSWRAHMVAANIWLPPGTREHIDRESAFVTAMREMFPMPIPDSRDWQIEHRTTWGPL